MSRQPLLLAAGLNPRNLDLLAGVLHKAGYEVLVAGSLVEIDRAVNLDVPNLALIDLGGFDRRIWERCERLRDLGVPLLVMSARQSAEIQQESLAHGAQSFMVKPLVIKELLKLVEILLQE